jgi:hypothetical protein
MALNPSSSKVTIVVQDLCAWLSLDNPVSALDSLSLVLDPSNSKKTRNAVWFTPSMSYLTTIRLIFSISDSGPLGSYLASVLAGIFNITSAFVIARKQATWNWSHAANPKNNWQSSITYGISLNFGQIQQTPRIALEGILKIDSQYTTILLICDSSVTFEGILSLFETIIDKVFGTTMPTIDSWIDPIVDLNAITARRFQLRMLNSPSGKSSLYSFSFDFEADMAVGNGSGDVASVLFDFSWNAVQGFSVGGTLWTRKLHRNDLGIYIDGLRTTKFDQS